MSVCLSHLSITGWLLAVATTAIWSKTCLPSSGSLGWPQGVSCFCSLPIAGLLNDRQSCFFKKKNLRAFHISQNLPKASFPSHLSQISLNVSHSPSWPGHVLPPCSFSVKSTHPFLCLSPFLSRFCSIALITVCLPNWALCSVYCSPFSAVNHCCAPSPMCSSVLLPPPSPPPHLYLLD